MAASYSDIKSERQRGNILHRPCSKDFAYRVRELECDRISVGEYARVEIQLGQSKNVAQDYLYVRLALVDLDGQRIRDFQPRIGLQPWSPPARPQHRFALALDISESPQERVGPVAVELPIRLVPDSHADEIGFPAHRLLEAASFLAIQSNPAVNEHFPRLASDPISI